MKAFYASLEHDDQFKREQFRATVGGKLAGLVFSAGKTAAAIARKCGMKPSQLSRQLSGDINLTLDTIHRIAEAVDAEIELNFKPRAAALSVSDFDPASLEDGWAVEIPETPLMINEAVEKANANFADLTKGASALADAMKAENTWTLTFDASLAANDHQFALMAEA